MTTASPSAAASPGLLVDPLELSYRISGIRWAE